LIESLACRKGFFSSRSCFAIPGLIQAIQQNLNNGAIYAPLLKQSGITGMSSPRYLGLPVSNDVAGHFKI
jgi:hypothetical protein